MKEDFSEPLSIGYGLKGLEDVVVTLREAPYEYNTNLRQRDKSFKVLFEVKSQFIQLVKTYIKGDWVNELNEENIELADKEFTTVSLLERRADVIYKIKLKKQEIYFFLLEIQNTSDRMMPFRLMEYMFEIYRKYMKDGKLPAVIPCVLYTGKKKWNVGTIRSLFNVRRELKKYMPNFEYILIDVNNYTDKELTKTANLISSVFFLTKSKNPSEVTSRIKELVETASKLTVEEQKSLSKWAKMIFIKNTKIQEDIEDYLYIEKEEEEMTLEDFLPDTVIEMIKEGEAKGELKGKAEGILEGSARGKVFSIIKLLKKKMRNEPSQEIVGKLESLSLDKLEAVEEIIIDRIFTLDSWEEVEEILGCI